MKRIKCLADLPSIIQFGLDLLLSLPDHSMFLFQKNLINLVVVFTATLTQDILDYYKSVASR